MKDWIKETLERNRRKERMQNVDLDLHGSMSMQRAFRTFGPVLLAVVLAGELTEHYLSTIGRDPTTTEQQSTQVPIMRQMNFQAVTYDGQYVNLIVNARQIRNTDLQGWCELAWMAKIKQIVSFAGTVEVNGQVHIDDWINGSEGGLIDHIAHELKGTTIESKSCVLDILTAAVKSQ